MLCPPQATDFLITGSVDGHLKFWKKKPEGVEFVKHFRAHKGAIAGDEADVPRRDHSRFVLSSRFAHPVAASMEARSMILRGAKVVVQTAAHAATSAVRVDSRVLVSPGRIRPPSVSKRKADFLGGFTLEVVTNAAQAWR